MSNTCERCRRPTALPSTVAAMPRKMDVHASTISPAQQSYSETTGHTGNRDISDSPLVAETVVVSTPTSTLCGPPSLLSIPPRSPVSTESEIRLRRKVLPLAHMEALMRHYKAACFSDEVSRLAAVPRRPSINPIACTMIGGFASLAGPQGRDLILLVPQLLK